MADFIIGGIILALLILAGYKSYKNYKKNKCGCGCTGCSRAGKCPDEE